MWTGSIEKKYGVSRKPGSKKDPPASYAKQAPTEAEGGEEEEKEQDPIVQPDDVSCTSKRKRKQKEAEPTENPAPRAFKRLRPLKSKSSQDVTTTPPEKKKSRKRKIRRWKPKQQSRVKVHLKNVRQKPKQVSLGNDRQKRSKKHRQRPLLIQKCLPLDSEAKKQHSW